MVGLMPCLSAYSIYKVQMKILQFPYHKMSPMLINLNNTFLLYSIDNAECSKIRQGKDESSRLSRTFEILILLPMSTHSPA